MFRVLRLHHMSLTLYLVQFVSSFSLTSPFFYSSLLLPLTHSFPLSLSLSSSNTTSHDLIKSTAARTCACFCRQVSLPFSPGVDYTLSLSLGFTTISLYMDIRSNIVGLPGHPFECTLYEDKYSPSAVPHSGPLNLTSATFIGCKSLACFTVHSSLPSCNRCAIAKCPLESIKISDCISFPCPLFYYAYGDESFVAKLFHDSVDSKIGAAAGNPQFHFRMCR